MPICTYSDLLKRKMEIVVIFIINLACTKVCVGEFSKLVVAKKSNAVKPHGDITKKKQLINGLNNIFFHN